MGIRFNASALYAESRRQENAQILYAAIFILLLLLAFAGFKIGAAQLEASAFNRLTGSDVSLWDALVLELRVDGKPL